jgi:pseudouridine synthase
MGRLSLVDLVPDDILSRYHPVGRLDADTSGLLLFSRIGPLTQRLLHPKHGLPRSYLATCESPFTPEHVSALELGVETSLGTFSATVTHTDGHEIELAVTEGKYRMVRRMLANVGQPVVTLTRVKYGPFTLDEMSLETFRDPSKVEWHAAAELELPGFEARVGDSL